MKTGKNKYNKYCAPIFYVVSVLLLFNMCGRTNSTLPVYTYSIINTYPHDTQAFTQGLVFSDGSLFEGTGLYGKSALRRVDLFTGSVLQEHTLSENYFGEGITVYSGRIIQLTWTSGTGFIYDKESFTLLKQFSYKHQGWGITNSGNCLIISDGTSALRFLDPETLTEVKTITVKKGGEHLDMLNELEYINGKIYANIWQTQEIAIIDPDNGSVTGIIDLSGLRDICLEQSPKNIDVLNGIAFNSENSAIYVTGKLWPLVFEIEIISK